MLKSPMKFGFRSSAKDYQLSSGVTQVQGIPSTDACDKKLTIAADASHISTSADTITFDAAHGLNDRDCVGWDDSSGTPPAVFTKSFKTYYVIVVDELTIQLTDVPGSTALNIADTGSGSLTLSRYVRAKFVLPTNYGSYPIGIRPCIGPSYTMDTDDEFVLRHDAAVPIPLNVAGFDSIAAESIGGDGDLRITALENF